MLRVRIEHDRVRHEPTLRVDASLGTAFAALPKEMQHRIIEEKLTRALRHAQDVLDHADVDVMSA